MSRRAALVLALLLACGGGGGGSGGLAGELSARTDEYGAWTVSPSDCYSGERQLFFGADLVDGGDVADAVRIVLDPLDGYALAMNVPGHDAAIVLREDDGCETFDLRIERGNTRLNNIWEVFGHARVVCRLADLEVDADLEFSGCF